MASRDQGVHRIRVVTVSLAAAAVAGSVGAGLLAHAATTGTSAASSTSSGTDQQSTEQQAGGWGAAPSLGDGTSSAPQARSGGS